MQNEIEKIIQADETACQTLEAAKKAAGLLQEEAQQTAQRIMAERDQALAAELHAEQARVFSESEAKVHQIREEVDRYIEHINQKKQAMGDTLLNNLLRMVTAK